MTEITLPDLIQQMLQPGFYPHQVQEPIRLIQTHCSYVLLTGDFVYKVKKSINFGFLNYSTLELRQNFCHEELRLNQRGAAELYLEVLPITQAGEKYQLAGSGEAVEYTLKMQEFPDDGLFTTMFEQGKLGEAEIAELGRVVAAYHSQIQTNEYISSFGEVPQVRASIDQNYDQTVNYVGGPQTAKQFEETKKYTDNFFATKTELFKSRVAGNFIRECHGDLHLRNICLWHDQILLFDCIEFNEPFRFVDVMYEVAFTVMDLEAKQRQDLANVFLNTYIEQTGDWEGLQLLPLYQSRQAYVRAKVTSFLLDDPGVPADAKAEASQTAAAYYQQAWKYTQPRQGKLILMSGVSGSGKSTTGKYLAQQLGAIHLRSDAVRKHLGGVPLYEKGSSDLYSAEMTEKTYSRLLKLGILLADQGYTVILDAKYDRQNLRGDVIKAATAQQIPLQIIQCTAPVEILKERLEKRQSESTYRGNSFSGKVGDIADATADLLTSQLQQMESFTDAEKIYVKILNTTEPLAAQLDGVISQ
jgi:uncharacterized protein